MDVPSSHLRLGLSPTYPSPVLARVRRLPGRRWDPRRRPDSAAGREMLRNVLGVERFDRDLVTDLPSFPAIQSFKASSRHPPTAWSAPSTSPWSLPHRMRVPASVAGV